MRYSLLKAVFRLAAVGALFVSASACSPAFRHQDVTLTPEDLANPSISTGGKDAPYQAFYSGTKTLSENNCDAVSDEVGAELPLSLDVIQSGDVISVEFEDGNEASGTLRSNKVDVLVKHAALNYIYELSFNEDGAEGSIKVMPVSTEGQIGETCAAYDVVLAKSQKPKGESQAKK